MHPQYTPSTYENAMPALTRRALVVGAAAAIGAPSTLLASDHADDDELAWLIDQHGELRDACDKVEAAIHQLYQDRGYRPPEIELSEVSGGMYGVGWHRCRFITLFEIDRFFTEHPDVIWWDEVRQAVHAENHKRARELFIERQAVATAWNDASGLTALWDRESELVDLMGPLDRRIVAFQCRTYGEVVAKVRWIEREFGDEISQEHAVRVLRSLAGIAAAANSEVV